MLKIKDSVDLKELEKFGFKKTENSDWKHMNKEREIYVVSNDYDIGISKDTTDKLYDLIQSGLVEKC